MNNTLQTCPLCDVTVDDARAVYTHLQVNHRKSELSKAVLEAADTMDRSAPAQ